MSIGVSGRELNELAEELRLSANSELGEAFTAGQVLTPSSVARLMAAAILPQADRSRVRLLDPGAGTGILVAAAVAQLLESTLPPESINALAVETDSRLIPYLQRTLDLCADTCASCGVEFSGNVLCQDFVALATRSVGQGRLALQPTLETEPQYSLVMMNPPYKKISSRSHERRLLSEAGIEVSNLYAGFVALATRLLKDGGQLVAITPRSFCNGTYFKRFRRELLDLVSLQEIYLFESRSAAFADAGVLQESLIFSASRGPENKGRVSIGVGNGKSEDRAGCMVEYDRVIWPDDKDCIIHVVTTEEELKIADWMQAQPTRIEDLGLSVSTGRVVDFRAAHLLLEEAQEGAAPLIYPAHVRQGRTQWPVEGSKPNWISQAAQGSKLLIPLETYVLVKRFTAKEERRRLVAAVFDPEHYPHHVSVGFENHLNYFHVKGGGIEPTLAYGLATYLNSRRVDRFFRQFSGHTQVNAADLRKLRYPDLGSLRKVGGVARDRLCSGRPLPDWEDVEGSVDEKSAA